jgi:hypothetical protein
MLFTTEIDRPLMQDQANLTGCYRADSGSVGLVGHQNLMDHIGHGSVGLKDPHT